MKRQINLYTQEEIERAKKLYPKYIQFKHSENKNDSFRQAVFKAYKSTPIYTLDKMVESEKKYLKKAINAQNKALKIRKQINKFTYSLLQKEN